jgi:hypothetical protein
VFGDPYLWSARDRLAALALRARLPTSFIFVEHVEAGGLMSYGADTRRATIENRSGDQPQDSTVLGLTIPGALELQAARLID